MDGRTDGTDGGTDGWVDGWVEGWMGGGGWMDGWAGGWKDGWLCHAPFTPAVHLTTSVETAQGRPCTFCVPHLSQPCSLMSPRQSLSSPRSYRFLLPSKAPNLSLALEETHSFWFNSPRLAVIALSCGKQRPPMMTAPRTGRGAGGLGRKSGRALEWSED